MGCFPAEGYFRELFCGLKGLQIKWFKACLVSVLTVRLFVVILYKAAIVPLNQIKSNLRK